MSESKVWGIPCPGDPSDERLTLAYRARFRLYATNQQVRHALGLHQRPGHYSIAPRCDWCGHRSPAQKAIAAANRRAFDEAAARAELHPDAEVAAGTTEEDDK